MTPDREAAIEAAVESTPAQISTTLFAYAVAAKAYDAGASASQARVEALEKLLQGFVTTMQTYHGCSDLGCPYKTPPNQQGTNGGCGCHYEASFGSHVRSLFDNAKAALR